MAEDDAEVTARALAAGRGDRDAAARFVRATQQQVRRFLAALVSPAEADDLAQETFPGGAGPGGPCRRREGAVLAAGAPGRHRGRLTRRTWG
jgi:hypothetical protein